MSIKREPFGMFFVHVNPDSPTEKVLALATMAPYFIVCALVTLIVRCRELVTISWLTGQLLNEVANFVLKRLFKQARPDGAPNVGFDGHGMPSAHSQFMGFFLAFAMCLLASRVRCASILKTAAGLLATLLTGMVCYSRIHLEFHTIEQVIVGVSVGLLLGSLWFLFCKAFLFARFPAFASSALGCFLQLRDARDVDNVLDFEYNAYRICKDINKSL